MSLSDRARIVERRTYLRPLDEDNTRFETPDEAIDRQIEHQRWLWRRAKAGMVRGSDSEWIMSDLSSREEAELEELRGILNRHEAVLAGRTRWLGGTAIARKREASQLNCSGTKVRSVHDVVDVMWLLLQGCGVGFEPVVGTLNGFSRYIPDIEVIRSTRTRKGGRETNKETWDPTSGVWKISVGDSAEAWAKAVGKLVAGKYPAEKLVIDLSNIRPAGGRLSGYGWICSGDSALSKAMEAIAHILNSRIDQLLTHIDILDIVNWLGTTLSSRRSAQIAIYPYGAPGWEEFALAKKEHWNTGNPQRAQSNNTLYFTHKPTKYQLRRIFRMMEEAGGSEPGLMNYSETLRRSPFFSTVNPCLEATLADGGFCNLVELNLPVFNGRDADLMRATYIVGRANYRQTCMDLRDGVLQTRWHENNEFIRLCGVGVTGVVSWEHVDEPDAWRDLRVTAVRGTESMAEDLGTPRPKNTTLLKPSGTASKSLGTKDFEIPEGIHKPLGRFIFNRIGFSRHDPLVDKLREADYLIEDNPYDPTGVLVVFPVEYKNIDFTKKTIEREGRPVEVEVNEESAVEQLDRYRLVMRNYVQQNASVTISYAPDEVDDIVSWLMENWDDYVGVSFIYRNDPTRTAEDLGYPYLPQTVVDEETFRAYKGSLRHVDLVNDREDQILDMDDCASGACPVR